MNIRLRKELLQLRSAWITALLLALVPLPLLPGFGGNEWTEKMILYLLGLIFLGIASFGSEFNLRTLPLLLSQPRERSEIWREKLSALALATISVWLLFTISILFSSSLSFSILFFGLTAAAATTGIALFASLVFRQMIPAFTITLLLAALFIPTAESWLNGSLNSWQSFAVSASLVAIAILSFTLSFRFFEQTEDQPVEESAFGTVSKTKTRSRRCQQPQSPTFALFLKELRLQQTTLVYGLIVFAILAPLLLLFHKLSIPSLLDGTTLGLLLALLFFPLLAGSISIAEERKLGTDDFQSALPVSRGKQFLIKAIVGFGIAWLLGALLPAILIHSVPAKSFPELLHEIRFPILLGFLSIPAFLSFSLSLFFSSFTKTTPAALLASTIPLTLVLIPLAVLLVDDKFYWSTILPFFAALILFLLAFTNRVAIAKRGLNRTITLAQGVAGAAVLLSAIWLILDFSAGQMLRNSLNSWEKAGLPTKLSEIIPEPVPADQNAALVLEPLYSTLDISGNYRLGWKQFEAIVESTDSLWREIMQNEVSEKTIHQLGEQLDDPRLQNRISLLQKAVTRPSFRPDIDYEDSAMELPYIGVFHGSYRYLEAEMVLQTAQDDWKQATTSLITGLKLSELLKEEPFLISRLIQADIRSRVFEKLKSLLQFPENQNQETIDIWKTELNQLQPIDLIQAIESEFSLISILQVERLNAGKPRFSERLFDDEIFGLDFVDRPFFRPLDKADTAVYLRESQSRIEQFNRLAKGETDKTTFLEIQENAERDMPFYAPITKLILPSFSDSFLNRIKYSETELLVAKTALAIHQFHIDQGNWPETLAALVPHYLNEIPLDPSGSETLRYVYEPNHIYLAGIAPHQTWTFLQTGQPAP